MTQNDEISQGAPPKRQISSRRLAILLFPLGIIAYMGLMYAHWERVEFTTQKDAEERAINWNAQSKGKSYAEIRDSVQQCYNVIPLPRSADATEKWMRDKQLESCKANQLYGTHWDSAYLNAWGLALFTLVFQALLCGFAASIVGIGVLHAYRFAIGDLWRWLTGRS